ncbi:MAG: hypothetical protein D6815_01205 [Candidatus Dadabacteria bacterium]|nr:MAG: hypothetical protein D6815_01205 [Candidatus Dadabacteria bacterium]
MFVYVSPSAERKRQQLRQAARCCLSMLCIAGIVGCAATGYERLVQAAAQRQNRYDFESAERLHWQALQELRQASDVDEVELARQLSNHASALNLLGRAAEARAELEEALQLLEQQPDPPADRLYHVYANLGRSLELLGELEQAAAYYTTSIQLGTETLGLPPDQLGFQVAGLANIYARQGRDKLAQIFYRVAKLFYRWRYGENSYWWQRREKEFLDIRKANEIAGRQATE